MSRRSQFSDEEFPTTRKKPKRIQPANKLERRIEKAVSCVLALSIWFLVRKNIDEKDAREISGMQSQAEKKGAPLIIDTTSSTITTKVNKIITGKKEPRNTVIINPHGVEPAIQVITPDATITANKTGEIEKITPAENTAEKPLTETEAQSTVKEALEDAVEKTLPKKEEPLNPLIIPEKKK
ncbi:MAG: hypothetical protein WC753_03535 [Candidatus Gracilibacteria bacterium]